jgi:hypothetical protein
LAYTGKTEYASSDAYFDDVLFYYLRKAGFPSVTPLSEEPSAEDLAAPHYSAVYMAAMAKRIFGDEAAEKLKSRSQIRSGTDALYLSEDGTYYSYVSFTAPAYETVPSHSVEYVTSEKIENGYTVDVRYFRRAGYETSDFWISGVCEGEGATLYSRTEAASEEPTGWVILAAVKAYAINDASMLKRLQRMRAEEALHPDLYVRSNYVRRYYGNTYWWYFIYGM